MLRLRDIMRTDVVTVDPQLSIRDAIELLAARHIGGAPVVTGGKVVGLISVTDLLGFVASTPPAPRERLDQAEWGGWEEPRALGDDEENEPSGTYFSELWSDVGADVGERFDKVDTPEWDRLAEHTVSEAMTREVQALTSEATVELAAERMSDLGIHRIVVVDAGVLQGIVTTTDIARAVADHEITTRTYVFDGKHGPDPRSWP